MGKPYVIVIEGLDGSGKKTQSDLLEKRLKEFNKRVFKKSVPFYEFESSKPVKMFLNGDFEHNNGLTPYSISVLYSVDRACAMNQLYGEFFNSEYAIFDRYVQSNMMYQSARIEGMKEKKDFLKWIADLEYEKMKLPKPDLVLFLNVPPEITFEISNSRTDQKSGNDNDVNEKNFAFIKKTSENAKWVVEQEKWITVDCAENGKLKPMMEIAENIWQIVKKHIKLN